MARREWYGKLPLRTVTVVSGKAQVGIQHAEAISGQCGRWILGKGRVVGQIVWHSGPDPIKINGVELQSGIMARKRGEEAAFVYYSSPPTRVEVYA